ncbi:hypothetical protein FPOA_10099 [Fusarium poae]|uniref:Uncharacterized protein n=1 Tax=Fusarium poae TaxID=36050 RepID=A0A1B8AD63_FUSPO|nr:hypothetical protein FPOA_10099 [Fusarium poae]
MAPRMSLFTGRLAVLTARLTPRTSSLAVQCSRPYSSQPPKPRRNDEVKFWPFLVVALVGTGGYVALVNRRSGRIHNPDPHKKFTSSF